MFDDIHQSSAQILGVVDRVRERGFIYYLLDVKELKSTNYNPYYLGPISL